MKDLELDLVALRRVINLILDRMEQEAGSSRVAVTLDNYWDVPSFMRYDFSNVPDGQTFEHGQLYHDWEFLTAILEDETQAVRPMLMHVAPLLRYLGERG